MLIVPLMTMKTISWFFAGGFISLGAGLTTGLFYVVKGIKNFINYKENNLHKDSGLLNTQSKRILRDNVKVIDGLNTKDMQQVKLIKKTKEINNQIFDSLLTDTAQVFAQTKESAKKYNQASEVLKTLSTQIDEEGKILVSKLQKYLSYLENSQQDLISIQQIFHITENFKKEIKRLEIICSDLTGLQIHKDAELKKLKDQNYQLINVVQKLNAKILCLLEPNSNLQMNLNLEEVNLRKSDTLKLAWFNKQSDSQFFHRESQINYDRSMLELVKS